VKKPGCTFSFHNGLHKSPKQEECQAYLECDSIHI
jgi:hypothetical protein